MRIEIKRLRTRIPTTSVFVTHDQVEAMTLGDRVVVMMDGRIQQVGTPLEVYNAPANKFVASFIGAPAMNFFEVNIVGEGDRVYARTPFFSLPVGPARHRSLAPFAGKSVIAGIRPEHLLLAENGTPDTFEAKVEVIEQLGAEIVLEARAKEAEITVARVEASTPLQQGQLIRLGAKPGAMQFFEIGSEAAIL
jgi:multiple sugar transport system ATP-binding protein